MNRVHRYHALIFMLFSLLVAGLLRLPNLPATPPGLHYDEAANAILAGEIGFDGYRPIFISSYTGKEVLFFYLAGGLTRLVGNSVFALRLTAAFIGLLTVAATYWLGRELLIDRRIALLAAALLTVSFWHLIFSRYGFRAISEPLLQALTVAALFRGLRRGAWLWLVIGGIFLGLTAYTYLAARLFPIPLALAMLPLLLNRRTYRRRWQQLLLFAVVALVVLTPLLGYFITHPDAFWVRITQVAPDEAAPSLTISESYLRSLAMFFLVGDPYIRFNLPGRPLFNWFWGGLLLVGWIVCLLRCAKVAVDWQLASLLLLILMPFFMILPTALAVNEIVPSNLRAIGLAPFIFYLPAIGLLTLVGDVGKRFQSFSLTRASLSIGLVILLLGGIVSHRLYFREWAGQSELFYASDGDLAAMARFLEEADFANKSVYVAALHYQHPTLAFLSSHYGDIKWLPNSLALPFPAEGTALYIYPHSSPAPEWASPYLGADWPATLMGEPEINNAFSAYELSRPPSLEIPNRVNANFGNTITLLGYEIEAADSGTTLPLILYWQVTGIPSADFTPFVHLEDAWRHRWGQAETFAYPAAQWAIGETIIQQVELPIGPGTPPGSYRVRVGLFNPATGERLAQLDQDGRYAGDAFVIEEARITAGQLPAHPPTPPITLNQLVHPGLSLMGYERSNSRVATGDTFDLALWWRATKPLPHITTRLELMRPNNTGRILLKTQPVHGTYPFEQWHTPQFLIDRLSPRIPDNFPPGDYQLTLRLLDGDDQTLLTANLGSLTIEATQRQFTQPAVQYPLAATLGNEIALLGYDLETGDRASEFILSLVWQALERPAADYTVFVHVLNPDGTCCAWQQDVMPRQNQYPTSRWAAEEVVTDTYQIVLPDDLPSGDYLIEVGLYLADTGRRLQVLTPGLKASDAVHLRPLPVP